VVGTDGRGGKQWYVQTHEFAIFTHRTKELRWYRHFSIRFERRERIRESGSMSESGQTKRAEVRGKASSRRRRAGSNHYDC
jgi:hypothetical protein